MNAFNSFHSTYFVEVFSCNWKWRADYYNVVGWCFYDSLGWLLIWMTFRRIHKSRNHRVKLCLVLINKTPPDKNGLSFSFSWKAQLRSDKKFRLVSWLIHGLQSSRNVYVKGKYFCYHIWKSLFSDMVWLFLSFWEWTNVFHSTVWINSFENNEQCIHPKRQTMAHQHTMHISVCLFVCASMS